MVEIRVFEPVPTLAHDDAPACEAARARFAADVVWLRSQGGWIERVELGLAPLTLPDLQRVRQFLARHGVEGLPLVIVRNRIVLHGRYPTREELARLAGLADFPPR